MLQNINSSVSGLSQAKLLYRKSNYDEAAELFRKCQSSDEAEAFFYLGSMILDGLIDPKDNEKADDLLRKSADLGFLPARYRLESLSGHVYDEKSGDREIIDTDIDDSGKALTESDSILGNKRHKEQVVYYANQGNVGAMYEYGMMNLSSSNKNANLGAFWLGRAAQKGHALSQYELGLLYLKGEGVTKDDLMAVIWLGRAKEQGVYKAYCQLATVYTDRKSRFYNPKKGVKLLNQVKDLCPDAYLILAKIYLRDDILQYDADKAKEYLEKAKSQGVIGAYVESARLFITERKYHEALPLLKYGSAKNDSEAQYLLGSVYELFQKEHVFGNLSKDELLKTMFDTDANEYSKDGISDGDAVFSQKNNSLPVIGNEVIFHDKESVLNSSAGKADSRIDDEKLQKKIIELYKKSAEGGHIDALYRLACIYSDLGNKEEAEHWYKEAANKDHVEALYRYGCILRKKADEELLQQNEDDGIADSIPGVFTIVAPGIKRYQGNSLENSRLHNRKYQEAFEYLSRAAAKSHTDAQYLLSQMYANGQGTRQDTSQSILWCERAANNGNMDAQMYMAELYDKGEELDLNLQKSLEWYGQASEKGNALASYRLGKMYFDGRGVLKNYNTAFSLYQKAAENGNSMAMNALALCYIKGYGCEKNEEQAERYLSRAVQLGNDDSVDSLTTLYMDPQSSVYNPQKAMALLEKEVSLGHSQSVLILSRLYLSGDGVPKSIKVGLELLERVVHEGNREALYELGMIYFEGKLVERNYRRAVSLIRKSADQKYVNALYMMGVCSYRGLGMMPKTREAIEYFKRAGELGYKKAYLALGKMYENGIGGVKDLKEAANYYRILVNANYDKAYSLLANIYIGNDTQMPNNYDEAEKWLFIGAKKGIPECLYKLGLLHITQKVRNSLAEYGVGLIREAAEADYDEALYYLAKLYVDGRILKRDYPRAIGYLQRAVAKNHLESTTLLGKMYRYGMGCDINSILASDLLLTAAKCGNCEAQLELAKMYRDGDGVDKSYVDAYMWSVLCISFDKNYREALKFKKTILPLLSQRELKNAQIMAVHYLDIIDDKIIKDPLIDL
ncbi:MAG: sel1 repeat family protein [Ruminobacter sp.]|nr:sel1 repeat family protein [Ruminobacter sp.]